MALKLNQTLARTVALAGLSLACGLGMAGTSPGAHGAGHAHGSHGGAENLAIGEAGKSSLVKRTVTIEMNDAMRFKPASIQVKQGETVRFLVKNVGKLKHEMVLGTQAELKEHYEVMQKNPEMEHADPNMTTVAAGQTGEIIWTFSKAGQVDFACLQPGHYEAGMKGSVTVAARAKKMPMPNHSEHQH